MVKYVGVSQFDSCGLRHSSWEFPTETATVRSLSEVTEQTNSLSYKQAYRRLVYASIEIDSGGLHSIRVRELPTISDSP